MSCLAWSRILALAAGVLALILGGLSRVFRARGKKTWARERMVGRRAPGVSVRRTKWQKSFGSSKVLRKAFWAASFMALAGVITKKRSRVSRLLVRARKSRICSTEMRWVALDSSGVRKMAFLRAGAFGAVFLTGFLEVVLVGSSVLAGAPRMSGGTTKIEQLVLRAISGISVKLLKNILCLEIIWRFGSGQNYEIGLSWV